jgi:hypothetical protein
LGASAAIEAFPAFVANRRDPLLVFSDAAVHADCLRRHPRGEEALQRRDELLARCGPGRRVCGVCGEEITRPEEYFGTGYLGPPSTPLGAFNCVQLHRACFARWARAEDLIARLDEAEQSGSWEGPRLMCDPLPRFVRVVGGLTPQPD